MTTEKYKCPICENKAWKEDIKQFIIDDLNKSGKSLKYIFCEECGYILDSEMY